MEELKNKRHEAFCRAYCTELNGRLYNASQAAIKAGYSVKTSRSQGSRLLTDDNIKSRIVELKAKYLKELEIDALWVLGKYKKILEDDISNYLKFGMFEKTYVDDLGQKSTSEEFQVIGKNSDEIDTWNISEISQGKDGTFKFKLHCKDKALAKMGEYIGLFKGEKDDDASSLEEQLKAVKTLSDYLLNPQPNRSLDDEGVENE